MKTQSSSHEFLLFFRDTQLAKRLSPQEMQALTVEWIQWVQRLRKQGKIKDGRPLEQGGSLISHKSGGLKANAPLIASEQTITAFSLLKVRHLNEATEIAKGCPVLKYGSTIEVRRVAQKD